jgi:hypothetical protein
VNELRTFTEFEACLKRAVAAMNSHPQTFPTILLQARRLDVAWRSSRTILPIEEGEATKTETRAGLKSNIAAGNCGARSQLM